MSKKGNNNKKSRIKIIFNSETTILIIVLTLMLGSVVILSAKNREKEYSANLTPTSSPTSILTETKKMNPTPMPTIMPKTNTQNSTNSLPSRTGSIIKYHEWCTQKDISIYQNELITKKSSDGNIYSMPQGDWDCYEKYLQQKGAKTTQNNYNPPNTSGANNYPPCTIYYPALKYSQTYYVTSEECLKWKSNANATTTLITCVVSYPCNGTSYTYQVDQSTCNFMQSGAASTCSTADAIKKMQEISNYQPDLPKITPADYSIHMDPTPTPLKVPVGYP